MTGTWAAGARPGGGRVLRRARPRMGTFVAVSLRGEEAEDLERAMRCAFAEVDRLEAILSEWRTDGPVAAVNAAAGKAPVPVPPELLEVLRVALEVAEATQGAFDPTWAALAGLWRFDGARGRVPARSEVRERLRLVGYRDLEVDAVGSTVFLRRARMRLGLGGVAKAYVAERAAEVAIRSGARGVLVDAGGDVVARSHRDDRPWVLAVRDPRAPGRALAAVELGNGALATSGDGEACFVARGRRYHHLLDPRTGYPAEGTRSLTVLAREGARADALATGLFVLGAERAAAALARLPGVVALRVDDDGSISASTSGRPFTECSRSR